MSGAASLRGWCDSSETLSRVPEPVHQDHELESRMRENRLSGLGVGRRPKAVLYPHHKQPRPLRGLFFSTLGRRYACAAPLFVRSQASLESVHSILKRVPHSAQRLWRDCVSRPCPRPDRAQGPELSRKPVPLPAPSLFSVPFAPQPLMAGTGGRPVQFLEAIRP